MKQILFLIVIFHSSIVIGQVVTKVASVTQEPLLKPLPTTEQYARSLAQALLNDKINNSSVKAHEDVLNQWKQVNPKMNDSERYRLAALILEKENPIAQVAVECHKKRFWEINPFGYTIYDNFNNPNSFIGKIGGFFAGILSVIVLANIVPR